MSIENLLKQRFEVIADFPMNNLPIGFIIYSENLKAIDFEKFPHLFKKLKWFEKRNESEMPIFLKHSIDKEKFTFHKIEKWDMQYMFGFTNIEKREVCDLRTWADDYNYLPATEEEYLQFCDKA